MTQLRRRATAVVIPRQVAKEVDSPNSKLRRWLQTYAPIAVVRLNDSEATVYYRLARQPEIDEGEAAAIALAISRPLPLIIEEDPGRRKAQDHGVTCHAARDFLTGQV